MKRAHRNRQGAVLLSALGVLVLSFLLLGAFMTLNALRAGIIRQEGRGLRAYYAARSGAEAAMHFLGGREDFDPSTPAETALSGNREERPPADERFFIHFHERGEGFFSGRIFEGARCEVSWERDEASDGEAYIIKSTGIVAGRGSEAGRRTVYAYAEKHGGNFYITRWYE